MSNDTPWEGPRNSFPSPNRLKFFPTGCILILQPVYEINKRGNVK